jgi:DNA ligase D-like protein (predicted polymerase)
MFPNKSHLSHLVFFLLNSPPFAARQKTTQYLQEELWLIFHIFARRPISLVRSQASYPFPTFVPAASSGASKTSILRREKKVRGTSRHDEYAGEGPTTVAEMTLSHPDRVLFPDDGLTKLALARYYDHVSAWLLPHLHGRPLTLVRCPEGHDKECFYQKHANDTVPDAIGRVKIQDEKGMEWYMIADTLPAVIGLVQMGVLELHTWGAKRDALDRPDRIILDLDPGPRVPWKHVIEAALLVKTLLNELALECFVKTTGGKGLHVVLPLQRVHTWDEVKAFAKGLADHLVRLIPDRFVANMSKHKRTGKIYVEYLRNARGATAIAAYSTRARAGAPVSIPLAWEELSNEIRSDHFTVANVPARLKGLKEDPWREYRTVKQKLTQTMKAAISASWRRHKTRCLQIPRVLSILFIDGNATDRRYYAQQLTACSPDYQIFEAADGPAGLALYQSQRIDCVVLELNLRAQSSFDVLVDLVPIVRRSQVAVIVLTRVSQPGLWELANRNGVFAYLYKPYTSGEDLNSAIQRAISAVGLVPKEDPPQPI